MPTLNIEGRRVKVSDDFMALSPEDQQKTVEEIAQSLGISAQKPPSGEVPENRPENRPEITDGGNNFVGEGGEQPDIRERMSQVGIRNPITAFSRSALDAVPFVGHKLVEGYDELAAQGQAFFHGVPIEKARENVDLTNGIYERGSPIESTAGTVFGTVAPFAYAGMAPGVARALGTTGTLPQRMLFGGGSGATIAGGDTLARTGDVGKAVDAAKWGGVLGGLAPAALGAADDMVKAGWNRVLKAMSRSGTPEIDDLYRAKTAAYKAVDDLGAQYSGESYDDLLNGIIKRAGEDHISPTRHAKAFSMLEDLERRRGPKSLIELDQLRQEIRRDLGNLTDGGEAHFGRMMIDEIDDFIARAKPSFVRGGRPEAANEAILAARQANTILRKSEMVEDAIVRAQRRAASTGSGGNIDNALRQNIRQILDNPKKVRSFSAEERQAMEKIVEGGGKMQDALRLLGRLSPSGNGLMTALNLGATAYNPMMAIPGGIGIGAKMAADSTTRAGVNRLTSQVRTGGALPKPPSMTETLMRNRTTSLPPPLPPLVLERQRTSLSQ